MKKLLLLIMLTIGCSATSVTHEELKPRSWQLDKERLWSMKSADKGITCTFKVTQEEDQYIYYFKMVNTEETETHFVSWELLDRLVNGGIDTMWCLSPKECKEITLKHKEPPVWHSGRVRVWHFSGEDEKLSGITMSDYHFYHASSMDASGPLPESYAKIHPERLP